MFGTGPFLTHLGNFRFNTGCRLKIKIENNRNHAMPDFLKANFKEKAQITAIDICLIFNVL